MADFGTDEGGGFNAISRSYKNDPTIEHYVKLRRENPDAEIEVSVVGGLMNPLIFPDSKTPDFEVPRSC